MSENGITLIALVLTIIVLLILAGVSLNLVAGSNGILNRATSAVNTTKQAQLEEELQLGLAEIMMDYYIEGNGKTLQEYIIEQCNKPENNGMLEVGNGIFSSIDGELYYTDSNGNISMITVDDNGKVSIEGSISADGTVNDTNPPSIFATATTNSISIVIKDPLSGITGWAYTTTNTEPNEWNEVSGNLKSYSETITDLTNGTTYYIWAKDANDNKSQVKEVTTLEIGKNITFSKPSWNGSIATYQVTGEQAGCHLEYKIGTEGNWEKIESNTVSVQSGETLFVCLTDGNNKGESVSTSPRATYYIKYNSNDGIGTMENSTHEHLTASKLAENTFTKDGYTFVGWSKSANGTKEFDNQAEITDLSNSNGEIINLYAVWTSTLATTKIKPANYGDKAKYSANGVDDWQVFLNDGSYVYLISDDYVPVSGMTLGTGISKVDDSLYCVYGNNVDNLVNWLLDTLKWNKYATGFSDTIATGGPTLSQFVGSYNAKYNTNYSASTSQPAWFPTYYPDPMYFLTNNTRASIYCLATGHTSNEILLWNIYNDGSITADIYETKSRGVRPLVRLPNTVKAAKYGETWTFGL